MFIPDPYVETNTRSLNAHKCRYEQAQTNRKRLCLSTPCRMPCNKTNEIDILPEAKSSNALQMQTKCFEDDVTFSIQDSYPKNKNPPNSRPCEECYGCCTVMAAAAFLIYPVQIKKNASSCQSEPASTALDVRHDSLAQS